jgi:hypothetical protein
VSEVLRKTGLLLSLRNRLNRLRLLRRSTTYTALSRLRRANLLI